MSHFSMCTTKPFFQFLLFIEPFFGLTEQIYQHCQSINKVNLFKGVRQQQ